MTEDFPKLVATGAYGRSIIHKFSTSYSYFYTTGCEYDSE